MDHDANRSRIQGSLSTSTTTTAFYVQVSTNNHVLAATNPSNPQHYPVSATVKKVQGTSLIPFLWNLNFLRYNLINYIDNIRLVLQKTSKNARLYYLCYGCKYN